MVGLAPPLANETNTWFYPLDNKTSRVNHFEIHADRLAAMTSLLQAQCLLQGAAGSLTFDLLFPSGNEVSLSLSLQTVTSDTRPTWCRCT